MTRYVCKNCDYRFEAKKKKRCPYCGKKKLEKEKSAEELVDSINPE